MLSKLFGSAKAGTKRPMQGAGLGNFTGGSGRTTVTAEQPVQVTAIQGGQLAEAQDMEPMRVGNVLQLVRPNQNEIEANQQPRLIAQQETGSVQQSTNASSQSMTPKQRTRREAQKVEDIEAGLRMWGTGTKKGEAPLIEARRLKVGVIIHQDNTATLVATHEGYGASTLIGMVTGEVSKHYPIRPIHYQCDSSLLAALYEHYSTSSGGSAPKENERDEKNTWNQALDFGKTYLVKAMETDSSDLHFEVRNLNGRSELNVKIRVDGDLVDLEATTNPSLITLANKFTAALYQSQFTSDASRSESNFNYRQPQRGMPIIPELGNLRLRLQTIVDTDGYDLILRLLGHDGVNRTQASLVDLGFEEDQIVMLNRAIAMNKGLTLIMGPTGSGKTNTLSAMLATDPDQTLRKRYAIEDPSEIRVPNLTNAFVQQSDSDLTQDAWTTGLKGFLRGDPDVVVIGEIRTRATAEIAVEMAMTGHNVLSSLHVNSNSAALSRLTGNMLQIDPSLLGASGCQINLFVTQTLIQKLCDACKVRLVDVLNDPLYEIDQGLVNAMCEFDGMSDEDGTPLQSVFVRRRQGKDSTKCGSCSGRGIRGRTLAAEVTDYSFLDPFKFQEILEGKQFVKLGVEFLKSRGTRFNEPGMAGKTTLGHALYKVALGVIGFDDFAKAFPGFELTLKQYTQLGVNRGLLKGKESV